MMIEQGDKVIKKNSCVNLNIKSKVGCITRAHATDASGSEQKL